MLIRIPRTGDSSESQVTPESVYRSRRQLLLASAGITASLTLPARAGSALYGEVEAVDAPAWLQDALSRARLESALPQGEVLSPFSAASTYNNFYEFGTDKGDPSRYAHKLVTQPWSVMVDGEVEKPANYTLEDLVRPQQLVERIYRLRCVEGWSMVIPWLGFPLADLLRQVQPTGKARFVRFETVVQSRNMPGARSGFSLIDWPYVEGLRLDEAMHPLTILAVGMYGRVLPNQNGAPLRLVVPWKYGFKSIKSIVRISLLAEQPRTTWELIAPEEYGFYANVNPQVDHPRWSQAQERRLPASLFSQNVLPTQMFNGYSEVASLYSGMDLRKYY